MKEFAIYIDESGSPKPNPKDSTPYFAMGGVLIERENEERVQDALGAFKERWAISSDTPFHASEIRAKRDHFAWLGTLSESESERFHNELAQMVTSCPVTMHACVISRRGYCNRYLEQYGTETWEMMKTALTILLERTAKFVARHDGQVMVYYERIGKRENTLIESHFHSFRSNGHPFNHENADKYSPLPILELEKRLYGIEGKTKKNPILQLADLCLYPVAQGKNNPSNRALIAMQKARLIVDNHLTQEEVISEGIKYYCFD